MRLGDREYLPERRKHRASDHRQLAASLLAIGLMTAFFVTGYLEVRRIGRDERNRLGDLRASCRRASARNAADVNLNWIYYLSEHQLAATPASDSTFRRLLRTLTPAEQRFLLILSSGNPSRHILQVRAEADYHAAYVKAQSIDFRDAGLVHLRTPLGSGRTPRRWVLRAHYDCGRVYR